jgi:hypothetical protein
MQANNAFLAALANCIKETPSAFQTDQLEKVYVKAVIRAVFPDSWKKLVGAMPKRTTSDAQLDALQALPVSSISSAEFAVLLNAIRAEAKTTPDGFELSGSNIHAATLKLPCLTQVARQLEPAGSSVAVLADVLSIASLAECEAARRMPLSTQFYQLAKTSFTAVNSYYIPLLKLPNRDDRLAELASTLDLLKVDFSMLPGGTDWASQLSADVWHAKRQAAQPRVERSRLEQQITEQLREYGKLYSTLNIKAISRPLSEKCEGLSIQSLVSEPNFRKANLALLKKESLRRVNASLDVEIALLAQHQLSDAEALQQTRQLAEEIRQQRIKLVQNALRQKVYQQPGGRDALEWRDTVDLMRDSIAEVRESVGKMQEHINLLARFQIVK